MKLAAAFGLAGVVGCPGLGLPGGRVVFKRSGRGLLVSNAAKKHNANRLYATLEAATADLAHPGDNSRVVQVTISSALFLQLFPAGKLVADLRRDL